MEIDGRIVRFPDFYNTVHLDEKCFTLETDGEGVWIYDDEQWDVAPIILHKIRVPKVMFIAAIGWSHRRPDHILCNGLIGVWHFVQAQKVERKLKKPGSWNGDFCPCESEQPSLLAERQGEVFPAIRQSYYYVKRKVIVQINGARSHTAAGIHGALEAEVVKAGGVLNASRHITGTKS